MRIGSARDTGRARAFGGGCVGGPVTGRLDEPGDLTHGRNGGAALAWRQQGTWWFVAFLLLAAAGGGVAAWANHGWGATLTANALSPMGPAAGGVLTFDAPAAGDVYYLGFAPFANTSSQPVHVLGYQIATVSPNLQVLGYRVYSTNQFGDRLLAGYDPTRPEPDLSFDVTRPLGMPYVIRAHTQSPRFAMAKVRLLTYPPPAFAKGCIVTYRLGTSTRRHLQRFDCTFYFGQTAADYFDGETTLTVVNSYPRDVLLLGCPVCKSKGVRLTEGSDIGWALNRNDSRPVAVVVDGRRVQCNPPPTMAARSARYGPDLTYDITMHGRCVLLR